MIDTIRITLPYGKYHESENSTTPFWTMTKGDHRYTHEAKQLTNMQKLSGVYYPRIKRVKRGKAVLLQVEFSAPKMLFGNNVDEVCEKDFPKIVKVLQARLAELGVNVFTHDLEKAPISTFHPSKNIDLSSGYTATGVIRELQKINLTQKMDLNKDSFRNDGHSLQLYANSHSLVFYDKIKDLKKSKKRAIDKDQTLAQMTLFQDISISPTPTEILRMEVRLTDKRKMNALLKENELAPNSTFHDVFKENVCQKILLWYWKKMIVNENLFLFSLVSNPQSIFQNIMTTFPEIKPKEAIYLMGLYHLSRDADGLRGLRTRVETKASKRSWYRYTRDMKRLNEATKATDCHQWVYDIEQQITTYTPLKIHDLLCKEL